MLGTLNLSSWSEKKEKKGMKENSGPFLESTEPLDAKKSDVGGVGIAGL